VIIAGFDYIIRMLIGDGINNIRGGKNKRSRRKTKKRKI
jgi:hypothetical protein